MRMYIPLKEAAYGKSDCLIVSVDFVKNSYSPENSGYILSIIPGGVDRYSYFIEYCADYYTYRKMTDILVLSSRRNKKREAEACEKAIANIQKYIDEYIDYVVARGGKKLEPVGGLMSGNEMRRTKGIPVNEVLVHDNIPT